MGRDRCPQLERLISFSNRENQILKLLKEGISNKLIARSLTLSEATVKVHVRSIFLKTGAKNRTQVALWATDSSEPGGSPTSIPVDPAKT